MILTINTQHHVTVELIITHFDLHQDCKIESEKEGLVIHWRDDCLSQEFAFWAAMAEGCGLIEGYTFEREK